MVSPLASGALWDASTDGSMAAAGLAANSVPELMKFGLDDGRLPFATALAVTVLGGLGIVYALREQPVVVKPGEKTEENEAVAARP